MSQVDLRKVYERVLGRKVSDRTWRRIRNYLWIGDDFDPSFTKIVIRAASKRRENATASISRKAIAFEMNVESAFLDHLYPISGRELFEEVKRVLGTPNLSRQTMYRWGRDINCRFNMNRQYSKEHLKVWAVKLFPYYQPKSEAA